MAQKFNNQHYCTKGISERLPIMTQIFLWGLIETMEVPEQDYLQVFTLSVENGQQKVLHEQEFPEYSAEHLFPSTDPIEGKIFVIDDETHSTILFAFSKTILAILTCLSAGSSNVEAITSALTLLDISVTSSGRSSMRSTIMYTSG